ncbi:putative serine protease F56F10.1 [Sergentomyia squamirostris]
MLTVRVLLLVFALVGGSLATKRSFWRGRATDEFHGDTSNLSQEKPLPNVEWFVQQNDPYGLLDNRTFYQRYYVNIEFFKSKDGPVFLFIGREGPVSPRWMMEGAWLKYAQEFGALCLQIEHRYYGESHAKGSTINEEYGMFSSEIALTDIALFITEMQKTFELTSNNRWVVFGGGYAGALAAWVRLKFPQWVHGAVTSSAPLLGKADFREYYDVVANAIIDCRPSVQEAFQEIEKNLETSTGRSSLSEQLQLCDSMEIYGELDKANLFENLASIFAHVVQYNGIPYFKYSIQEVCDIMNDDSKGSPLNRLAHLNKIFLDDDGLSCLDYKYDKMINELKETNWEEDASKNGTLHWFLQMCKEYGWFQTSNNASHIFRNYFPIEFYYTQCSEVFGDFFNQLALAKSIYNNNVIYGGLGIRATNVIYVYGSLDPWHTLGLTESKSAGFKSIFIPGTSHCADMYEPMENDPPELKNARKQIREFIAEILNPK